MYSNNTLHTNSNHFSGVYEGVKMVPTTLPVSENTVLVDMKLCTKPHGFTWTTSMASKSRASALRVKDNVFRAQRYVSRYTGSQ